MWAQLTLISRTRLTTVLHYNLKLSLLLERPDLELRPVLLEHALAVVLPELLGGVLAGHALEDLGAARVVVEKACVCAGCVG